jgi:predicted DNA-binding ribbon-helix-helix protein
MFAPLVDQNRLIVEYYSQHLGGVNTSMIDESFFWAEVFLPLAARKAMK